MTNIEYRSWWCSQMTAQVHEGLAAWLHQHFSSCYEMQAEIQLKRLNNLTQKPG